MLKKLYTLILLLSALFISNLNSMSNTTGQPGRLDKEKAEEHIVPEQTFQIGAKLKNIDKESKKPLDDEKLIATFGGGKYKVGFSVRNRTEGFYGRSIQLLSPSPLDQTVYVQHTWDLKTDASLGDALKSLIVIRHKGRWGNPNTIARTTTETIKIADAVTGAHNHFLGKQVFWMREAWVDVLLNEAFCLNFKHKHYLTFGEFSFRLGRGIALGDAYAVSPGLLGFYSNNIIDQYAPAVLLHGNLRNNIKYDIYLGMLENLSDSFENVNEEIYAMQIGKRKCPQRGFGKLNYVLASRLIIDLLTKDKNCKGLRFEPYVLYNNTPEQDVDFPSDANSKLITAGAGLEYEGPVWEWGFEFAQNFGRQYVRPWDRNLIQIKRDKNTADLKLYYSEVSVKNEKGQLEPAPVTNKNKEIVNNSEQSPALNGQEIGNTGLYNDINRFRDGYKNIYNGFMFVTDASCKISDTFKVKGTFALASGDLDPNVDINDPNDADVDGVYSGFIGLQELYSGKRVPSVFIVGANQIARPLAVPSGENIPEEDLFAQNVKNFTNLVYYGVGFDWAPLFCGKKANIKPNLLMYWHEHATKKFSLKEKKTTNELASKYLGLELNVFIDVQLLNSLKGFFVGGIYVPGQYFKDVTGIPLNKTQREALKEVNDTGYNRARIPFLNHHMAVSLNWGFEYIF